MLNQYEVPVALSVWAVNNEYTGSNEDKSISATTLLKSVRQILLSRRASTNSEEDVIDKIDAAVGTAIHSAIEHAWVNNYKENLKVLGYSDKTIDAIKINPTEVHEGDIPVYLEQRIEKKVLDWTVTGQFDMVFNGQLIDFKTTGTYTYETGCKTNDYRMQGSIYRWLSPLITEDTIAINFIFKNWQESKINTPGYPKAKVLEQKIDLHSQTYVTTYVLDKITRLNKYYDSDEKDIPFCTADELQFKPSTFAYYANPDSKRATKVCDTAVEAYKLVNERGKGIVKERKGEPVACRFCKGRDLCSQYKTMMGV